MSRAILIACFAACLVECPAEAATCDQWRGHAVLAGQATGVPPRLLLALWMAESSCRAWATNRRTGARGLGQILPGGSAAKGHPAEALWDPHLNAILSAQHVARWRRRCGTWRGAITIYHGHRRCSVRSRHADKVITAWRNVKS